MQTFTKEERLSSNLAIANLLRDGASFSVHPFKAVWTQEKKETKFPAQIAISVSKISFKKAVDRNRIKRLVREAYRKNKSVLYDFLHQKKNHLHYSADLLRKKRDSLSGSRE